MENEIQNSTKSPEEFDPVLTEEISRDSVERDIRRILGEDVIDSLEPVKLQALIDEFIWGRLEAYADALQKLTVEGGSRNGIAATLLEPVAGSISDRMRYFTGLLDAETISDDTPS